MRKSNKKLSGNFEFNKEFLSQFEDQASLKHYMQEFRRTVMEEML